MILYNASTGEGVRNFARRFSHTDDTTYVDIDIDASINRYLDIFTTEILEAMDGWDFQGETATADLVASQTEYTFPTDILKIKRIEYTYDGTTWEKVEFFDVNERGRAMDSTSITNDFSVNEPFADLHDNSLFLYPTPTTSIVGGLKIWYEKLPTQLSGVTDEPPFSRPFHIGLAYGAAQDYLEEHVDQEGNETRLITARTNKEDVIDKMKKFYRRRVQDRPYIVKSAFRDYGYDDFNIASNRTTNR